MITPFNIFSLINWTFVASSDLVPRFWQYESVFIYFIGDSSSMLLPSSVGCFLFITKFLGEDTPSVTISLSVTCTCGNGEMLLLMGHKVVNQLHFFINTKIVRAGQFRKNATLGCGWNNRGVGVDISVTLFSILF